MLRRVLRTELGERTVAVLDAAGRRPARRGPRRSTSRPGPRSPARGRDDGVTARRTGGSAPRPSSRCRCGSSGTRRRLPRARGADRLGRRAVRRRRRSSPVRPASARGQRAATRDVPADATNLVVARRAAAAAGVDVAITLRKQIPPGAGLGGGSSDAAAVLRVLRGRLRARPGRAPRRPRPTLGSDVPFCLHGGPAWMRGRGEVIEPVPATGPVPVVSWSRRSRSRRPPSTGRGTSSAARAPTARSPPAGARRLTSSAARRTTSSPRPSTSSRGSRRSARRSRGRGRRAARSSPGAARRAGSRSTIRSERAGDGDPGGARARRRDLRGSGRRRRERGAGAVDVGPAGATDPAGDAASASSSAASCASSCACACGAS